MNGVGQLLCMWTGRVVGLRLSLSFVYPLPCPHPWTSEMPEEEWEDTEPRRNLFGAVATKGAAESLGVRGKHEENWERRSEVVRSKAFQVCSSF